MSSKQLKRIDRFVDFNVTVYNDDCIKVLKAMEPKSVHCCVTSPPYYRLRDYGTATWKGGDPKCNHIEKKTRSDGDRDTPGGKGGSFRADAIQYSNVCGKCGAKRIDKQIGLEKTPDEYVKNLVKVFREVKRVLRPDGVLWLNLGDSYAKGKCKAQNNSTELSPKNLLGIPWRVALALQSDGWILRTDVIWSKSNPIPEPVTDRPTKAHEYLFLFSKQDQYYYDHEAIKEKCIKTGTDKHLAGGHGERAGTRQGLIGQTYRTTRNKRSVWTVAVNPFQGAHFATFPEKLIEPCIKSGCPEGGTVLDPFTGSGTTGIVARKYGCHFIGIELNKDYMKIIRERIETIQGDLFQGAL